MAAITLEEAKHYLRVDTSDDDVLISQLLATAQAVVEEYTNRKLDESEGDVLEGLKTGVKTALAILYENRGEVDAQRVISSINAICWPFRNLEL